MEPCTDHARIGHDQSRTFNLSIRGASATSLKEYPVIDQQPSQAANPQGHKKPYVSPVLLEYGHVAKLTEGGQGSYPDNKTMRKKPKK